MLPSANVVFDTGRCPQRSVFARNVLITHCHLDHLGGLPHHIASRLVFGPVLHWQWRKQGQCRALLRFTCLSTSNCGLGKVKLELRHGE